MGETSERASLGFSTNSICTRNVCGPTTYYVSSSVMENISIEFDRIFYIYDEQNHLTPLRQVGVTMNDS